MKRLAAAVAIAAALLAGCTPDEPKKGWVTNRGHSDAWVQIITTYHCGSYNSKGVCTSQVPSQQIVNWPAKWWLILKKENGDRDKAYVSEAVWEAQPIHSWYAELPDDRR